MLFGKLKAIYEKSGECGSKIVELMMKEWALDTLIGFNYFIIVSQ
jgi:hypothetical protein